MYTIALQGVENTGKTETLNLLIDFINKGGVFSDIEIRYINERNPNNKDRICWCNFVGNKRTVKIGITTRGDYEGCLRTDFQGASRRNFADRDVVVCPVRSAGSSVNYVKNQATDGLRIVEKKRVAQADMSEVNSSQAKEILEVLKQHCCTLGG